MGGRWYRAEVVALAAQTPRVRSLTLAVPEWPGHRAGQHVELRLTAPDGYRAVRSYSIASAPGEAGLELAVERIAGGEVSPYLTGELRVGDLLEVSAPIGGHFVWTPREAPRRALLLLAGGAGIVPLRAMLRARAAAAATGACVPPARLLYSARTQAALLYRRELDRLAAADATLGVWYTLTREAPPTPGVAFHRRLDAAMLAVVLGPGPDGAALLPPPHRPATEAATPGPMPPIAYCCGPHAFVEAAAAGLLALGLPARHIRTERFGPSG